jgi:hypothetical protein
MTDEGSAEVRACPHPTSLRSATFSRKREKARAQRKTPGRRPRGFQLQDRSLDQKSRVMRRRAWIWPSEDFVKHWFTTATAHWVTPAKFAFRLKS